MTPAIDQNSPFHAGEQQLQHKAGKREVMENFGRKVIRDFMPPQHRTFYGQLPFMVAGCVDGDGWPWASMLCGPAGFIQSPTEKSLQIQRSTVEALRLKQDPLAQALLTVGQSVGLLGIELPTRRRNRVNVAVADATQDVVLEVQQAFGNCPQYIQTRHFHYHRQADIAAHNAAMNTQTLTSLNQEAIRLIERADTFFVASAFPEAQRLAGASQKQKAAYGVDVSHRGGLPGFVKVEGNTLTIPDYAGNFHFNTLGNFLLNPKAGLVFPDFVTGELLLLTGSVEILDDNDPEIKAFKGAERGWRFSLHKGLSIKEALPFTATLDEYSPNSAISGTWQETHELMQTQRQKDHWQPLRLVNIERESDSVKSFYFEHADGKYLLPFLGGQHLTVELQSPLIEQSLLATYTLSGPPNAPYYRISVKRNAQGNNDKKSASLFLHEHLQIGDVIKAKRPSGHFTLDAASKQPAILLAGGIGITPALAMAEAVVLAGLRTRYTRPLVIIHTVPTLAERTFYTRLRELARQSHGAIQYYSVVSRASDVNEQGDYDARGRINREFLQHILPQDNYQAFLCGPTEFMQAMYGLLIQLGIADDNIFAEAFGPSQLQRSTPPMPPTQTTPEAEKCAITFTQEGVQVTWQQGDDNLLEVAEKAGLQPPFSCRSGSCGACKTTIVAGKVTYRNSPSAEYNEQEALICCAVPAAGTEHLKLKI